jgi:hypothetical protein
VSVRFLTDESLDGKVISGLLDRRPNLDLVRAQDVGLMTTDDRLILEWAARERRALLSPDRRTMVPFAGERVRRGEPMPGLFVVRRYAGTQRVIEDILIIDACSVESEWDGQIQYLPL